MKKNNFSFWRDCFLLTGLVLLALALRLWKITGFMVFLGDEGRDVLVVKKILEGKFTLLGPTASVGGFYLGPVYYYFIAPFLWLFRFNPVGPAVLVVLFSAATVGLLYLGSRLLFGWRVGLVTGLVYALSPLTIKYGRSSWNPNPLPFFALMGVGAMVWALKTNRWWLTLVSGISWGVALQLHYLALMIGPIAAFLALLLPPLGMVVKRWLGLAVGTVIGFSPFLLFELRHGFPNTQTVWRFLFRQETDPVGIRKPLELISQANSLAIRLAAWFFGFGLKWQAKVIHYLSSGFLLLLVLTLLLRKRGDRLGILSVAAWWLIGLFGLSLYQGQVYDYYFAFLYPVFALVIGIFLGRLLGWFPINLLGLIVLVLVIGQLIGVTPLQKKANYQFDQTGEIASVVLGRRQGEEYNFALLSGGNSDHAYRYFFEVWDQPPTPIEEKVVSQLMIVCEEKECPVLGHSLWEVAGFGRAEIAGLWQVRGGVKVYRLVHHPDSINYVGQPAPKG